MDANERIREFRRLHGMTTKHWSFVYMLRSLSEDNGVLRYVYKVGQTKNICRRIEQYGHFGYMANEFAISYCDVDDLRNNESSMIRWMQQLGCHAHIGREWFFTDSKKVDVRAKELMHAMLKSQNVYSESFANYLAHNNLQLLPKHRYAYPHLHHMEIKRIGDHCDQTFAYLLNLDI